MAFEDFPAQRQGVQLLQRSLERGRLAHAYLFTGHQLEELEALARTLAKTLNCRRPVRKNQAAVDCCDQCPSCRKIQEGNQGDVHWVRPESKSRVITVEQMRDLKQQINLKPAEAEHKIAIIVAADRLNVQAANAFLKTLEEPPQKSTLILLTNDAQRILETILSRCLRLNFAGPWQLPPAQLEWLTAFGEMAAADQKSLLGRFRLMDVLFRELNDARARIDEALTARSPLEHYEDAEKDLREKWEKELKAAIEAEYRRQRADLLGALQWWLRDVWVRALAKRGANGRSTAEDLLNFPGLQGTERVAQRISAGQALENVENMEQLQGWLGTNVQEALALEVGLLKLHL